MKTDSKKLLAALDNARHVCSRRNTLPVLSYVRVEATRGILKIQSTDLDQYQTEFLECEGGDLEPCLVSLEYLASAIGGKDCTITLENKWLVVKCDFGQTKLGTMDTGEFPEWPKAPKAVKQGVSCADLSKAVKSVAFCASKDAGRYILQSVFVKSDAKELAVVSTNGRELACCQLALIGAKFDFTIPSNFVNNACRWLALDGAVLKTDEAYTIVETPSGSYMCRKLDGSYPNYLTVIPTKKEKLGIVNSKEFSEILIRCVAFFKAGVDVNCRLEFQPKQILMNLKGDDGAQLDYTLAGKFEKFIIAINARAILMIAQNSTEENITLCRSDDELSPLRIDCGNLFYLSMPMRLK